MHHVNPLPALTRREMIGRIGAGFGTLGLAGVVGNPALAAPPTSVTGSTDWPRWPPTSLPGQST